MPDPMTSFQLMSSYFTVMAWGMCRPERCPALESSIFAALIHI
jgi:hypothetical protein